MGPGGAFCVSRALNARTRNRCLHTPAGQRCGSLLLQLQLDSRVTWSSSFSSYFPLFSYDLCASTIRVRRDYGRRRSGRPQDPLHVCTYNERKSKESLRDEKSDENTHHKSRVSECGVHFGINHCRWYGKVE